MVEGTQELILCLCTRLVPLWAKSSDDDPSKHGVGGHDWKSLSRLRAHTSCSIFIIRFYSGGP